MMMKLFPISAPALALAAALAFPSGDALAAAGAKPEARDWSFQGLFGTYDRGALQRGFQTYREVCAACHSLSLVAYRNLASIGLSEDQIKAVAAEYEVTDGPNEEGEMFSRPAKPSDRFAAPFANDNAARASNNGAMPPDLSLMTKARKGGPDYLYALLTGYKEEPPEAFLKAYEEKHDGKKFELMEGMEFNVYFPGNQIAMAAPLADDAVEYSDGTKPTLAQLSEDVTTFLAWAAEPELEERKRLGVKVLLFLIVLTAMLYALKRQVWSDQH